MTAHELNDKVRATIGEITLPTYRLTGENPNPVFHSQYGVAHIYPYTLQDEISSQASEVKYRTLILENKYLLMTLLPDLGGRVYSVFDKISNKDVFYKNPVIKFSPLAIRGAFFSGGIEFSFPVAHAPTTADPVNWDVQENKDGSASVCIGGQEHISGMRWQVKLSMFPGQCALAQDVYLFNPTPVPGRYHYWTNASLDSDDMTEFIYPLQRVRSYEFAGTASWPIGRLDLITDEPGLPGMEGVPIWPADRIHEPVNFRWEKDMLAQVSIFGRDVKWDYFGVWQHTSNTGYAHFAKWKDVSGMKLWSWGKSEVGMVNQYALMDDGSLYAETQCGAMETQLDFDFLMPGESRTWREWWLPLRGIGGLTCASEQAGAKIHLEQSQDLSSTCLNLAVCPSRRYEEAEIKAFIPGEMLLEKTITISPEQPWAGSASVDRSALSDNPLTIQLIRSDGFEILKYIHNRKPASVNSNDQNERFLENTADYYYSQGLRHENFDNRKEALASYSEALKIDSNFGPAHFQLGLMLIRNANYSGAKDHLESAVELGIKSAYYYLGLIANYEGEFESARKYFESVPEEDKLFTASVRASASFEMRMGRYTKAVELLTNQNLKTVNDIQTAVLMGIAYLRMGEDQKACEILKLVLEPDSFYLPVLRELSNLRTGRTKQYSEKYARLLKDDRQYVLDLACFYLDVGLVYDAMQILKEESQHWDYAMIYYLGAYLLQQSQEKDEANTWLSRAQLTNPDFVFPSRLWEINALREAITKNPQDCKAKYYLGNFLYARQQFDQAIQLWEEAQEGLADFDVIFRNLGLGYWKHKHDTGRAIMYFKKAMSINPNNQDLYILSDDIYKELGQSREREKLLASMQKLKPMREDLRKRTIVMMVELGKYDEALEKLLSEEFVPLEMDQSFHDIYVKALKTRAEDKIKANRIEDAIGDLLKALDFPMNLGVGRPILNRNAEILFRLGCAYELLGDYGSALQNWKKAANEHHKHGEELFEYVQMSLDKLGRYSEIGFEV